jgi:enoyl-CoA hydratase/carnithine racemase
MAAFSTRTRPSLADYAEKYAEHLAISRQDGIVEVRLHSRGGPAVYSLAARNAWAQALHEIGNDPANEVLVLTATGDAWVGAFDPDSFATPFREWPADVLHEHVYYDTAKLVESVVYGIDIPIVAAINGNGTHREFALLSDITIRTDTTVFADGHAAAGQPPGDGLQIAFQLLMGPKTAAYYLYTSERIDAQKALKLGLVNEVVSAGQLLPRAHAIAASIMRVPRITRRLTHAIVQCPIRRRLVEDFGFGFGTEMFGVLANKPSSP